MALALALPLGAGAGTPLELPAGESAEGWRQATTMVGLELAQTGTCPWVRFVPQGSEWVVQVCDARQSMREARISVPRTPSDREAAVLLAGSLLHSAEVGRVQGPVVAMPPAPPLEAAPTRVATVRRAAPEPEPEPEPRYKAGIRPTPEGAEPVAGDDVVEIGLDTGPPVSAAVLRDREELEADEELGDLDPGQGAAVPAGAPWWSVLVTARTWDRSNPAFGGRLRVGTTAPSGWRFGLEGQLAVPRVLLQDEGLALRDRTLELAVFAPLPGQVGAWVDLRGGLAWVTPVYEGLELQTLRAPVVSAGLGLPVAEGRGWAMITELGTSANLRGLELHWPDGRSDSMAIWQVEVGLGLRLGGFSPG